MAVTTNQQAHVYGQVAGGVLTVRRADGCVFARTGTGVFTLTVPAGFGSSAGSLKPSVELNAAGGVRVWQVVATSQTVTTVNVTDAAGAPQDPDDIWITLEIVPRIT